MALPMFTFSMEQILMVGIGAVAGWLLYVVRIFDDIQWVPERTKIKVSRKKGYPLILDTHPGSGGTVMYVGKKKRKDSVKFDIPGFGVHIDPNFTGMAEPMRLPKGLEMYIYPTTHPTPVSVKNMKALTQLVGSVRELEPTLNFLQDDEIIALLNTPRNFLENYCDTFEEKYRPIGGDDQCISSDEIMTAIIRVQDALSTEKVKFDDAPILIPTALRLTPSAYLAQDVQQLEILAQQEADRQSMFNPDHKFLMILGFIGLMVLVGGAVAYNMIT